MNRERTIIIERILLITCALAVALFLIGVVYMFRQYQKPASVPRNGQQSNAPLHLVPSATSTILFSDDFTDNKHNWNVGSRATYGSTIEKGVLMMMESNHKSFREPLPTNRMYGDADVSFELTFERGDKNDSAGLYFRARGTTGLGYYIDLYQNGTYDIAKISEDKNAQLNASFLAAPQKSAEIHGQGQKNNVRVIMKSGTIILIVNDSVVKSVDDNTFSAGNIMLFVENGNTSKGIVVTVDMLTVREAPSKLPD